MIGKELEEFIKDEVKAFEERLRVKAEELQGQIDNNDKPKTIWDLKTEDGEEYYRLFGDGDIDRLVFNADNDERARDIRNAFFN